MECPYGTLNVPDVVNVNTAGEDSEFTASCGGGGAPDASFLLTAPFDGIYVIDTVGSSIDTVLSVRDGMCGGPELACNDQGQGIGDQSRVGVTLTAGQTVTVVADGFAIGGGPIQLNVAAFEGTCPDTTLMAMAPQTISEDTLAADNTLFASCGGGQAGDNAYAFTAPAPGIYTIDTAGADFDTVLYVLDGCGGNELACNDDFGGETSRVNVTLAQDEEVVIVVDGADLETGNYDLNIDLEICPDPALDLGNTVPQTTMGSTVGGINHSGECTGGSAPDVGHRFTAPFTGTFVFDTFGSDYDTGLYIYDGETCMGDVALACDDDAGGTVQSQVVVDLVQDQVVTVMVDGFSTNSGNYTLNIDAPICGNDNLDPFEACDGDDLGGATCVSQGFPGGTLACDANCVLDETMCDSCGDSIANGADTCDGTALAATRCEDLGFVGGSLDCAVGCDMFDTSDCSDGVVRVCSSPGTAIDSLMPPAVDTITIPDMGNIADVDVFVNITHTYSGDLEMELSADDLSLSNELAFDACFGPNDVWAFFNDEAPLAAGVDCDEPFGIEGNLTPDQPLSVYDGGEASGSWTLTVTDDAGGDVGTLDEWCLYITLE